MKQHLHFNFRAKRYNIVPKSLRVKPLVNNEEGKEIAARSSKSFLKARISQNIRKITSLENDMMNHKIKISQELDEEYMSAVDKLREKAFQDMTEKCKIRQKKKFELILSRSSTRSAQKQDRYKEKWIVNNSSRVLSEREKEVLSKGLNFSPAPTRIPIPEIVVAVEEGLRKVISTVDNDKNVARKTIIDVLSKTKIPVTNITQEERKALKELKKDESIIILPADKGKATVILDRKEYDEKISAMLSETNKYKELKRDPAPALERKMNDMLISLKKVRFITTCHA